MIVSLFAARRTPDVSGVAHDLAVAMAERLGGQPVSLYVDNAIARAARAHEFVIEPRAITSSLRTLLGGLRPSEHAVVALVGPVTEPVITAFDLSARILIVTDAGVAALRATQRTFKLCHDVGYAGSRVHAVVVLEHGGAHDVETVRAALRDEPFSTVPGPDGDATTRQRAFLDLVDRVLDPT